MSLLNRRRVLLSAKGKVLLPKEYQQVEYLESTGTQYIDTLFLPNNKTRVLCEFEAPKCDTQHTTIFWASTGQDGRFNFHANYTRLGFSVGYGSYSIAEFGTKTKQKSVVDFNRNAVTVNDEMATLQKHTFTAARTMVFFNSLGHWGLELNQGKSQARIYAAKIYDDDTIVRDFIPCYRKSDNKAGMYDLVNGEFYTNQGTGEFILGGEV